MQTDGTEMVFWSTVKLTLVVGWFCQKSALSVESALDLGTGPQLDQGPTLDLSPIYYIVVVKLYFSNA